MRSGLMLLEVLVAMAILAAVLLPLLSAMDHSINQTEAGADHTDALALVQRISEELLHASQDADCPEALTAMQSDAPLPLRGGHPFLVALEDSGAEWGRLERQLDVGLDERAGETYRRYRAFTVQVSSAPLAGLPGAMEAAVRLSCPAPGARERILEFPLVLSFTPHPADLPADEPSAVMDAAIAAIAFARPTQPLERLVERAGADLNAVRDLGAVLVAMDALGRADERVAPVIAAVQQTLSLPAAGALERVDAETNLAILHERRAALVRAALLDIDPALHRQSRMLTRRALGNSPLARATVLLRMLSRPTTGGGGSWRIWTRRSVTTGRPAACWSRRACCGSGSWLSIARSST